MAASAQDSAALEAAYRKATLKLIGLSVFFVVCCTIAILARRLLKLPPALLTVAFFVALILFGADLWRFFRLRSAVHRMREAAP